MKGRIIGALWIIAALALTYFGWNGRFFNDLLFFSLMMALAEILAICECETWRMSKYELRHAHQTQCIILIMATFVALSLERSALTLVLVVCVISDVGAFTVGKLFGKHKAKIINHISPKKSYEGYIGGAILPIAAIWICPLIDVALAPATIGFIAVGGIAAEIGDLIGSAAKRRLGVKDSNEALVDKPVFRLLEYPVRGHGGYLDRVDSFSLSLVVYAVIQHVASLF